MKLTAEFFSDTEFLARFMSRYTSSGQCWIWSRPLSADGYGSIRFHQKAYRAHRVAFVLSHGSLDSSLTIDHLCRNRACVNPQHLEAVTNAENISRGEMASRTHCNYGHEYSPSNTRIRIDKEGFRSRRCIKCISAANKRHFAKRMALKDKS